MQLFHGSNRIVQNPQYGLGNKYNDYGLGFYTTEHVELAKEWACSEKKQGFANQYELELDGLSVLDLGKAEYHILNWLAILLENRVFRLKSDLMVTAKDYLIQEFGIDYQQYDVIKGYRADDSYFQFASLFLNNGISLEQLEQAMQLGNLGEQYVIKNQKAFDQLQFVGYEIATSPEYYLKKIYRDTKAREDFQKNKTMPGKGYYMIDILRGEWKNDDERIQRNISR